MRSPLVAVALALLAVTAGCNAALGGEEPTPDEPQPATTPTGTPVPPSEAPPSGPPVSPTRDRPADIGVTADGVTDPLRLANAHTTALLEDSFTMRYRRVARAPNGSRVGTVSRRARVAPSADRYVIRENRSGAYDDANEVSSLRAYANVSRGFLAWEFKGQPSYQRLYRRQMPIQSSDLTAKTTLYILFSGVGTRTTDVSRDGDTVVLELAAADGPHHLRDAPVTNLSLSATVERTGRVRSLRVAYERDGTGDGPLAGARVVEELRFDRLGRTTVGEPDWVGVVRNNTEPLPDEDGGTDDG